MIVASKKADLLLQHVFYIYYLIYFKKNQAEIDTLIEFGSEVNTITSEYIFKLGLKVWLINIRAQKIDRFIFKIFGIVLDSFQIDNKFEKSRFFQKTFLITGTNIEVILKILFLTLSIADT